MLTVKGRLLVRPLHWMRSLRKTSWAIAALPAARSLGLLMSLLFLVAPPAIFGQGSLTQVTVAPTDTTAGAGTIYTVSFITAGSIAPNAKIRLTFPAGFGINTVSLANNVSGLTGGYVTPAAAGQVLTLTRDNTGNTLAAGGTVVFKIAVVGNAGVAGSYRLFVETLTNANAVIDTAHSALFRVGTGPLHHVKVLTGPVGKTPEVGSVTLTADQIMEVHAGAFDALENYRSDVSVNWSVSGGIGALNQVTGVVSTILVANKTGSGQITADHVSSTVLDDATGTITVVPGTLAKVVVVEGSSGDGPPLNTRSLTTDQSLTVHAVGYDGDNNYISDQSVNWSVTGGIGQLSAASGIATTLDATTPGNGVIFADHATVTDDATDIITVSLGNPHRVKVLAGPTGATAEVTTTNLTTGGTLQVHASSFDADDNRIADVSVNWSVSGNIGLLSDATGTTTTLSAQTVGSGLITADHPILIDDATGTIIVSAGPLVKVRIVEGPSGNGPELGNVGATTDQSLVVHAAGYDAFDNYLGDATVSWSVTGSIGALNPTSGTATTLALSKPGSGVITADHATATDDFSGTITVTLGAAYRVKVLADASGNTSEVEAQAFTPGGTFTVHAASFDIDDNYIGDVSVTWTLSGGIGSLSSASGISTTFTATTGGTGIITADHATLIDDATGTITVTVTTGALSYVKVVEGAAGNGSELGARSLTTDQSLTVHAAGYDGNGVYLGDQTVTWSVSGGIGQLSSTLGTTTTLDARVPGSGVITANHATVTDDNSGTISVTLGAPHHVKILNSASGNTVEIGNLSLTAGQTQTVHASSYDADDNRIGDVSVNWSVSGGIGFVLPSSNSISTTLNTTTAGTGVIIADHASLADDATGTITVTSGTLNYVKIIEGASGNGQELGSKNLTTDATLTVHAAGYDANNNYVGDVLVNWTVSGGIGSISPATGISATLTLTIPGSGVITADHATAIDDGTGTITVTVGAPFRVKVLSDVSGNTAELDATSLQVGSTLPVHAATFDADDNYISDVSVSWSVSGGIGTLSSTLNTTTTLTALIVGSGLITADHATLIDDASGTITVTAGALAKVRIVEGETGPGLKMGNKSATTDQSLTVHAAGYDASDNYLGDQSVTWSVSGGIGTLAPPSGTSTTLTLTTIGSGAITADHATLTDDVSGLITVIAGAPNRVKVLAGASGITSPVGPQSLITGATLVVHAGLFDADGNYIDDVPVSWTLSNSIGTLNPASGISTTFTAQTAGTGIITADHATLLDGATGLITVTAGALSYVKIVQGTSGAGTELGNFNMTTDQTLIVHAAGYDASNNYVGDQTVTWSVSGSIGVLSNTLGTTTTLDARTPGSGIITADHATLTDDVSGTITVTAGAAHHVKVLDGPSGSTLEVGAVTLTAGQTLVVHAGSYDADENYLGEVSVNWSVSGGIGNLNPAAGVNTTFSATTAGSGIITADHATLLDDATGIITVGSGTLSYIKVVEGPSGNGTELTTKSLTADQTLTVHAAGYDVQNNYLGDQPVTWTVSGNIGTLSAATGTSTTLDAKTPGVGAINADHATATDDATGAITVTAGVPYRVKILSAVSGNTPEVTAQTLTTGQTLPVHAGSFDADDNYLADVSVNWSVSGGIGSLNPVSGNSTTFTATTAGSGVIFADHASLIDDATGTITVQSGVLSYIKIVEGPSGNGLELDTKSLTTDQTLTVHAAGYDAQNNYLGDQSVTWGLAGSIGVLSTGNGTSTTLDARTPGVGTITADHATATDDNTGTITVALGAPHHVKILNGASGATPEVTTATLITGQTLPVHASSFDADDNRITDVSVNWSVSGGIGSLNPLSGTGTVFTATTVGSGIITADHATLLDDATGTIVVNSGTLSYIKIIEGSSGNALELGNKTLTTEQTLTVHAAGYDANNNYLGDQAVTWSVSGGIGTLFPISGISTTLDATTPGTGIMTADHTTATDDVSGTITVTAGNPHHVKVLRGASGDSAEVTTATLITGQTLVVHAGSFDANENYLGDASVNWSVSGGIGSLTPPSGISTTLTATTVGSGIITADHATLIDDATGAIVVNSGNLSYIKIVEGPSGNGAELDTKSISTDQTLTVHAAGYDAQNNYLGDQTVTWNVSGGIGTLSTASGTATTLDAKVPGTGTISANHATATDDVTGTITVTPGALHHIRILGDASGSSPEVTTASLTTGQTLPVHAGSFDADDNYLADVSVNWSVSGGIGTLNPTSGVSTTFTATTAGSGTISADHASLIDDATGLITVTVGNLSYIKIVEGPAGPGSELGTKNLTTDETVTVHAAGYDAQNNYLGDQAVNWSVSGGIGGLNPLSGASTTLTLTRPGVGRIAADHATATDDETGDLTVVAGALARVKVLIGNSGDNPTVGNASLTTDQALIVHAGGFDADDNYISDVPVTWSVSGGIGTLNPTTGNSTTFTARRVGAGVITADHATASDGQSGTITVTPGALSFVKVIESLSGPGVELGDRTMRTDDVLPLHAAGFDADSNYVGDQTVTWSSAGNLTPVVTGTGASISFAPTLSPATGTIRATHASAGFDETGTITVTVGALRQIKILADASGATAEVGATTIVSGQTLVVHAASFDGDDNYIGDQVADWSVVGPIGMGTVVPPSGISTTFTAGASGNNGTIRARFGNLEDFTGAITIIPGGIAKIVLRTAPNNGGVPFNDLTVTADQEVTVYAAAYDAGETPLGDVSVTWSNTGNLQPTVSATGSSFAFVPTLANADNSVNGKIIGVYSPSIKDTTGTITVLPGNPSGTIALTPNPAGLPSDGTSTSTITSAAIKDADGNNVGAGKRFTVMLSPDNLGAITTTDLDPGTPDVQIETNASSQLNFTFRAGTAGGIVVVNVVSGFGASGSTQISLGSLNIVSVTTAPTLVSRGQDGIAVSMTVQNLSAAPLTEILPGLIFTGTANRTADYTVTPNAGNPATLPANATTPLSFIVKVNNNAALETVTIDGTISGKVNGTPVTATGAGQTDSWTVQVAATLVVQKVSTAPAAVSRGQTGVAITVRLANNPGLNNSAPATVDSLRLRFTQITPDDRNPEYVIVSTPNLPAVLAGNATADFTFTVNVSIAASLGPVTLDAAAYGREGNANTALADLNADTTDVWNVIEGDAFRITAITPSQNTVTAGMVKDWTVNMTVENTGSSNVGLNLAANKTFLRFTIGNQSVTSQYTITYPTALDEGGTVLGSRSTGHLTFGITNTGSTTGTMALFGVAEGRDSQTNLVVADSTNDFGNGAATVQSPGMLRIDRIEVSQSPVTANSGQDWTIIATITNEGESAVQMHPVLDSLKVTVGNNAGYVYVKPATFNDGSAILGNRETKRLEIVVDSTGSQTGTLPIRLNFKGIETNSDRLLAATGAGQVIVQTPAQARVRSVVLTGAPNLPYVNVSQAFAAEVSIENLGQETADSLKVVLISTNGTSQIFPTTLSIPEGLAGAASKTVTFNITASSTERAREEFRASITAMKGHNNGANLPPGPSLDDTANVRIQRPAELQVLQVLPSQSTVSAGQGTPWYIRALVTNTGAATFTLDFPRREFLKIMLNNVEQTDYGITVDPSFRRNQSLELAGGQTDTLRFTVTSTGLRSGLATLAVNLTGRDKNTNDTLSAQNNAAQVTVLSTSALQLLRTDPVTKRTLGEAGMVNVDQVFDIKLTVQNRGFEGVKDVVVRLRNKGASRIVTPEKTIPRIDSLQTQDILFSVQADTGAVAGAENDTLIATVVSGVTVAGNQPVGINPAADSTALVLVQRPARLAVAINNKNDNRILSISQNFTFSAMVSNSGQAPVNGGGLVRVIRPSGFTLQSGADEQSFTVGQPVTWQLRASPQANPAVLQVQISQPPKDLNIDAPAVLGIDNDTLNVTVVQSDLFIANLEITSPEGARDSVLSTGQRFQLTARLIFSGDLDSGKVHLEVPPGYIKLPPEPNFGEVATWQVEAPAQAQEIPAPLTVTATGLDGNGQPVPPAVRSLMVSTRDQASMNFSAEIFAPPGAIDGIVAFNQIFTIRANLLNDGSAGVKDTAKVALDPLQNGFTTAEALEKTIALGGHVDWQVQAPNGVANENISVRFTRVPLDENTGARAAVTANKTLQRIAMRTDSAGTLRILSWVIEAPRGAASTGILSTRQQFRVRAQVEGSRADNVNVELQYSSGFTTNESTQRQFVTLDGRADVSWTIQAPSQATLSGQLDSLHVKITGKDRNGAGDIRPERKSFAVQVVDQARLALTARISNPEKARDGIISRNQIFEVTARIRNSGTALATGAAQIQLTLPKDPDLSPAEDYRTDMPLQQNIADVSKDSVTWQIRARSKASSGIDVIILRLLRPDPVDQNTDSAATVDQREVSISVQTEPKRLFVQMLADTAGGPVASGEKSTRLLRLQLTNQSNFNSNNILLRAFTLHVRNRDNQPLNANSVIKALGVTGADRPTQILGEVTNIPAAETLKVAFNPADTLVGGRPQAVDVVADIAEGNAGAAFFVTFASAADVDAIDQESAEQVEVVFQDERGNTVEATQVVSQKRVIDEANFKKSFYNFPNPFSPFRENEEGWLGTKFKYYLAQASDVELRIYNLLGELVYEKSYKSSDPQGRFTGSFSYLTWDGKNGNGEVVLNGVYLAMMKTNAGMVTTKVAVVK